MLIADISLNRDILIDSIFVQRVDGTPPGRCKYVIRKPEGHTKIFYHKYSDGYLPLMCKVLNYLNKQRFQKKISN